MELSTFMVYPVKNGTIVPLVPPYHLGVRLGIIVLVVLNHSYVLLGFIVLLVSYGKFVIWKVNVRTFKVIMLQ